MFELKHFSFATNLVHSIAEIFSMLNFYACLPWLVKNQALDFFNVGVSRSSPFGHQVFVDQLSTIPWNWCYHQKKKQFRKAQKSLFTVLRIKLSPFTRKRKVVQLSYVILLSISNHNRKLHHIQWKLILFHATKIKWSALLVTGEIYNF